MRPESHETLCPIVLVYVLPEDTELCGPPPMIFNRVSTQDQRGRTLGSRTQDLFDPNAKGLCDPQNQDGFNVVVCSSFARRCVVSGMSTFIVGQALSTFMTPRTFPNDMQRRAESGYKSGVLSVHGSLTAALLLFACGGGAMERTDFVKVQSGDARSGDPFP